MKKKSGVKAKDKAWSGSGGKGSAKEDNSHERKVWRQCGMRTKGKDGRRRKIVALAESMD